MEPMDLVISNWIVYSRDHVRRVECDSELALLLGDYTSLLIDFSRSSLIYLLCQPVV